MSELPFMSVWIADFEQATADWDSEEVGAYWRLLMAQWSRGWLADDLDRLSRIARCKGPFADVWPIIEPKLPLCEDGKRRNPRTEKERRKALRKIEQNRAAAEARWHRNASASPDADADASPDADAGEYASQNQNQIQNKEVEPDSKPEKKNHRLTAAEFDEFWSLAVRKVGKRTARTALKAAVKRASLETIMEGWRRWGDVWRGVEAKFVPHPSTWLNRDGWEDELPTAARTEPERSELDRIKDAAIAEILREETNTSAETLAASEAAMNVGKAKDAAEVDRLLNEWRER